MSLKSTATVSSQFVEPGYGEEILYGRPEFIAKTDKDTCERASRMLPGNLGIS